MLTAKSSSSDPRRSTSPTASDLIDCQKDPGSFHNGKVRGPLDITDQVQYDALVNDPKAFIWNEFYRVVYPHVPFKYHEKSVNAMAAVIDEYDSPHRVYHDVGHLADVLFELRNPRWSRLLPNGDYLTAFIALVLHDYIYEIPTTTGMSNEERSSLAGDWFIRECGLDEKVYFFAVEDAILATEGHQPFDLIDLVVCWCDLWGFTKDDATVDANSAKIREEYLKAYTVEEYEAGRRKFLESYRSPFKTYKGAPLRLRIHARILNRTANCHLDRELAELNRSKS
jgi:predicted metal-dependent HD superfamily phosphohydrolase